MERKGKALRRQRPFEHRRLDVAAGEHGRDGLAPGVEAAGQKRRERHGTARLDDELQLVEGEGDGGQRLLVGDGDGAGAVRLVEREADRPRRGREESVANRTGGLLIGERPAGG